jgi:hypothetical protein
MLGKYPGDCLWAVVAFMIIAILMRSRSTGRIGSMASIVSFTVEALKLVPSEFLASVRHTTVGHLILGHTFMWQNLIAYSAGILGAMCVDIAICSRYRRVKIQPIKAPETAPPAVTPRAAAHVARAAVVAQL